jgi:hypothetical protein
MIWGRGGKRLWSILMHISSVYIVWLGKVTKASSQDGRTPSRKLISGLLNTKHDSELHNRDVQWILSCLFNDDISVGTCNVNIRWNENWQRKPKYSEETSLSEIFPPQVLHGLIKNQTLASVVGAVTLSVMLNYFWCKCCLRAKWQYCICSKFDATIILLKKK